MYRRSMLNPTCAPTTREISALSKYYSLNIAIHTRLGIVYYLVKNPVKTIYLKEIIKDNKARFLIGFQPDQQPQPPPTEHAARRAAPSRRDDSPPPPAAITKRVAFMTDPRREPQLFVRDRPT